jgi:hypothetical protein
MSLPFSDQLNLENAMAKKTWAQRMDAKPPHTVVTDKDFAGVPAGSKLLISSPKHIEKFLLAQPYGRNFTVQQMRKELAKQSRCDAACPVSTSIFLRIVAENAYERAQAGEPMETIPPVWRVIDAKSPLMKKLSFDTAWITIQRKLEGIED